jgi:DNA/RNA-binding domain of Phe-tRNA-synthetase-like protein
MAAFQYHPNIINRYQHVVGGVLVASGMSNSPTPATLNAIYQQEQEATLARIGNTPLSELETLAAWRTAFRSFGVNPTRYRSAAEALLRRLTKKGDIPNINTIVDICNLVSIRYALPVAAFDRRRLTGPITVQFADGSENFTPLFQEDSEHPETGEVIFMDDAGLVVARRWCWRQSDESATRIQTTASIFTIESHNPVGRSDIEAALRDLQELLNQFVGGNIRAGILDGNRPGL